MRSMDISIRLPGAIPKGMPYYDTQNNGVPVYNYNLAKAAEILNASGYTQTPCLKVITIDSITPLFVFGITQETQNDKKWRFPSKQELTNIGINSVVSTEGWPQYLNRMYNTIDWDFMFLGWMPDYNDPDDYIAPFVGSAANGGDTFNTGWANATVDLMHQQRKIQRRASKYEATHIQLRSTFISMILP